MPTDFATFFHAATGNAPYDYQSRLACGPDAKADQAATLMSGTTCDSRLISIPTGLGKTAAVVLAWLWNRVAQQRPDWPRRLVYCLPMRTLVEQTEAEVQKWLAELLKHADELCLTEAAGTDLRWLAKHSPVILMGGEELDEARRDWDVYPEKPAILIGTQDMLLSRALNRGYGMSRARWPMHFGLLNNDALWVMDEVQLMDVGLATSAQLQAFRRAMARLRPCLTWWMSATLRTDWLETADTHDLVASLRDSGIEIPTRERTGGLWSIAKPCELVAVKTTKDWAKKVWDTHTQSTVGNHGRITLVMANTVDTACQLHAELTTLRKKAKSASIELRLAHSRFRGMERTAWREAFLNRSACTPTADGIVVATQIVEAGVDISATTLFTELAPWASLVQRFGRAARYGGTAKVFVVDRGITDKSALPYTVEELEASRDVLTRSMLPDASLTGLAPFKKLTRICCRACSPTNRCTCSCGENSTSCSTPLPISPVLISTSAGSSAAAKNAMYSFSGAIFPHVPVRPIQSAPPARSSARFPSAKPATGFKQEPKVASGYGTIWTAAGARAAAMPFFPDKPSL